MLEDDNEVIPEEEPVVTKELLPNEVVDEEVLEDDNELTLEEKTAAIDELLSDVIVEVVSVEEELVVELTVKLDKLGAVDAKDTFILNLLFVRRSNI